MNERLTVRLCWITGRGVVLAYESAMRRARLGSLGPLLLMWGAMLRAIGSGQ